MWFLIFFHFINNDLTHYQLGQFKTQILCERAKKDAIVLVTKSTTSVNCFEAREEQE